MAQFHPFGMPISVLTFSPDNEVIVSNENLNNLFNHEEIQDRKVVILSMTGAFRGGKSFFLDYCLRFLYAHYPSINNPWAAIPLLFEKNANWMGEDDEPLSGFSWAAGFLRNTTGIIMWSDVFLHTIDTTGEKIAIFVMDTQGLFDRESTPADNSRIFALGTLISSIPILNLKGQIQEDHLEYLQFATEFAQHTVMNRETHHGKTFRNLMFLVRDWVNVNDFEYGINGGQQYLDIIIEPIPIVRNVVQPVRETINNSFEQIRCCLLPHPGNFVTTGNDYDGRWSEMEDTFRIELKASIEHLLMPDNLIKKKINGLDVSVKELKQYIEAYFSIFQSNEIPGSETIYELTVVNFMNGVIDKCLKDYKLTMFRNEDQGLQNIHVRCKTRALEMFDKERKMGSEEYKNTCKEVLVSKIEEVYSEFERFTEQERELLQNALEREEQQRREAEETRGQLEAAIKNLDTNTEEFNQVKNTLQARLDAEKEKLEEIRKQLEKEKAFTESLLPIAAAAGITGTAIAFIAINPTSVPLPPMELPVSLPPIEEAVAVASTNMPSIIPEFESSIYGAIGVTVAAILWALLKSKLNN